MLMHATGKIWKIENNKLKLTNHNEHEICSGKPFREKTELEGEIALPSLSRKRNGCNYKRVRLVAHGTLHYTNPLCFLSLYPLSSTFLIYGTKSALIKWNPFSSQWLGYNMA